jgi:hypothetical protein
MMEVTSTSETSVNFYQTIKRNIPEGSQLHPQQNIIRLFNPEEHITNFHLR